MKVKNMLKVFLLFCLLIFVTSRAHAKIPDIILAQKNAVVTVLIFEGDLQVALGSGFIVDSNGIIATNYHVISQWLESLNATLSVKMESGAFFPADEVIAVDKDHDIALFKVKGKNLPVVKFAQNHEPKQGDDVVAIVSPFGLEATVAEGIISGIRGRDGFLQITVPVSLGSSGSPIFNTNGEVIGVATFLIERGQNLNFAIPIKYVATLLKEPEKFQRYKEALPTRETDTAESHARRARDYIDKGQYDKAIEECTKAIAIRPDIASLFFYRGRAYSELKQYHAAINDFTKAISLEPDIALTYTSRGIEYLLIGEYDKAIVNFSKAISLKPDDIFSLYLRGYTYLLKEQQQKAKIDFDKACNLGDEGACKQLKELQAEEKRGEKWVYYASSGPFKFYYDKTTIVYQPDNKVRVWEMKVETYPSSYIKEREKKGLPTQGYENYSHTLVLSEYDCKNMKSGLLILLDYDKEGRILESFTVPSADMVPIVPDSIGEALSKIVCHKSLLNSLPEEKSQGKEKGKKLR